jgi:hypothetical protein
MKKVTKKLVKEVFAEPAQNFSDFQGHISK